MQQQCNPPVALNSLLIQCKNLMPRCKNIPLLLLLEAPTLGKPRSNSAIQIKQQPNSQAYSSTYKAQDLAGSTLNAVALQSELTTIALLRDQRSYTYFLDLPHIGVRTLAATARSSNQSSSAAPRSMYHQSGRGGSSLPGQLITSTYTKLLHFKTSQQPFCDTAREFTTLLCKSRQKVSTLTARHSMHVAGVNPN